MVNKNIIGILVAIAIILVGGYYFLQYGKTSGSTDVINEMSEDVDKIDEVGQTANNRVGEVFEKPEISFTTPAGWYRNDLDKKIFLTKTKELLEIGATEIYAYGPQMSLYQLGTDKDFQGVYEDFSGLESNLEFGTVTAGGTTFIKRVINASGTSNDILYYYLPANVENSRRIYTFTFYPYEKGSSLSDFNLFVESATKALSL